ncbi:MAG: FprA family A-type flavoprotein [Clostridiales bacterium]|nr:MAG: FprA family A-type flavoprotein [Clostridiales bacterium]HJA30578.1 FprA family A-type flavoprotein [Candidatus Eisenbergiella pullicola]
MHCVRKVTEDLYWIGANDHRLALFENIHPIPRGVSYNSYVLKDEKSVLFDTVDWSVCRQFLENLDYVLDGEKLDYIVINHMEPDHGASLEEVLMRHPEAKIVSTPKAFVMMHQFGFDVDSHEQIAVKEGETLSFGRHVVTFVNAPMVHWPEAMVTFDQTEGILFSADAFGTFGALDGKLFNDEVNFERDWLEDARRYYTNIVGKYGAPVQALLKKASKLDIRMVCPLHGPVWRSNLGWFIEKYDLWSRYVPEEKGVLIAYASMYGNTEAAAQALAAKLCEKGMANVAVYDVSNTHVSQLIAETFRFSHIVLASVTYNMEIYPVMHSYLNDMKGLNVQNRTVAIIENGTWACKSGELMARFVQEELKGMKVLEEKMTLCSTLKEEQADGLEALADRLIASMQEA